MKRIILTGLFCFFTIFIFAQATGDSLAYQRERTKINAMLARRKLMLNRYGESLSVHTGVFSSRTKKDIGHSGDILVDIVKKDDSIYRELKILLESTIFQRVQVQNNTKQTEEKNLSFMTAISKLRKQVDRLKADSLTQQQKYQKTKNMLIVALALMLVLLLYMLSRKRKIKTSSLPGTA